MKGFIFVIFLVVGGMFAAQQVWALTISPVRMDFSPNPGDLIESQLLLINEKKEVKTFYSSFENFRASGETGEPQFVEEKIGLSNWIETASQITLNPGEQKKIPFFIQVPEDAEPGGHFAAIFWGTNPPEGGETKGVSVGAKLGMLVLLRVGGEIKEEGLLLEFGAEDQKNFFNCLPVDFIYRFENKGNVQLRPKGDIKIKDIFGKTLVVLPANEAEGNVLPQSIRKFEVEWNPNEAEITDKTETTEKKNFLEELKNFPEEVM